MILGYFNGIVQRYSPKEFRQYLYTPRAFQRYSWSNGTTTHVEANDTMVGQIEEPRRLQPWFLIQTVLLPVSQHSFCLAIAQHITTHRGHLVNVEERITSTFARRQGRVAALAPNRTAGPDVFDPSLPAQRRQDVAWSGRSVCEQRSRGTFENSRFIQRPRRGSLRF